MFLLNWPVSVNVPSKTKQLYLHSIHKCIWYFSIIPLPVTTFTHILPLNAPHQWQNIYNLTPVLECGVDHASLHLLLHWMECLLKWDLVKLHNSLAGSKTYCSCMLWTFLSDSWVTTVLSLCGRDCRRRGLELHRSQLAHTGWWIIAAEHKSHFNVTLRDGGGQHDNICSAWL